jgi:glycosyltransferase involved in cell wall biosynthesis
VSATRVLRISHSVVVPEYRTRDRLLRSRYGYDVHLVSAPSSFEGGSVVVATGDPDVPVHVVDVAGRTGHPILFWYSGRELRRLLRELRPAIVDLHEEPYSLAAAGALAAVRAEAPGAKVCIYTAQNILKRYPPPFAQLERRALAAAAAAYPCSSEAGDVLRANGFTGAIHVLPLGVTVHPPAPRDFTSARLRVGFVGRLEPYKGADLAIGAFAKAAGDLDVSLEIVGGGSARASLEECAARLGVTSRVSFVGAVPQEDALARIAAYDVLLVPSRTTRRWKEQFGRTPAQAMEAGTPVIASRSGSLTEVLGGCGALVDEDDVDALADALGRLLRDPARRAELSRLGRRRAVECFAWDAVADGCDRMYRQMLDRS